MLIQMTQYLRPNGQQRILSLEIPDEYKKQYELIRECGCHLTCEQLSDERAVCYITNMHGDFSIKITLPHAIQEAHEALLKMISEFDEDDFEKWNSQFEE